MILPKFRQTKQDMIPIGHAIVAVIFAVINICNCANILMVTMGGTKSHKIPFWELARGLTPRGHNITFINAFPQDFIIDGLEEITPTGLVFYVKNFTNWDLLGAKMRGEEPVHPLDMLRYPYEACDILFADSEMKDFLHSGHSFDLAILDGAFPECALGLIYHFKIPFMYINTVGFYTGSLSTAGNPGPYSVTPFLARPFTDNMNLLERARNSLWHVSANLMHIVMVKMFLHSVLKKHFGEDIPHPYELSKNVSFILQNAHATVTYPRPYLPNVAEVACIHCKASKPLPSDLEDFIRGSGDNGFIYFSMGSSVRAANMPEYLRRMLLCVFKQLPQRVLWKWEADDMPDIPPNVKLNRWLPQQDLLGHPKIRAFVTHGGLLSMFETVYHGVPIVTIPVFCDHDSNAAKAQLDGYAIQLDLASMTADGLLRAIRRVIHNPKYKVNVKKMQYLLKDQKETPLERAVYWTEYVLKHKGAEHLLSPSRNLNVFQYYLIDVMLLCLGCLVSLYYVFKLSIKIVYRYFSGSVGFSAVRKSIKVE